MLVSRYQALPSGSRIAYIDESYQPREGRHAGHQPFYLMAAVILQDKDLTDTREDLIDIADGNWWHSTEFAMTTGGRTKIRNLVNYLAKYRDPCIIAAVRIGTTADTTDSEEMSSVKNMRSDCLKELATAIAGPASPLDQLTPDLLVFEKQNHSQDTDRDNWVLKQLRKEGAIPRTLSAVHVSSSVEPLLWLPDVVAHVYRRHATHSQRDVLELTQQTVTVIKSNPPGAVAVIRGVSPLFP